LPGPKADNPIDVFEATTFKPSDRVIADTLLNYLRQIAPHITTQQGVQLCMAMQIASGDENIRIPTSGYDGARIHRTTIDLVADNVTAYHGLPLERLPAIIATGISGTNKGAEFSEYVRKTGLSTGLYASESIAGALHYPSALYVDKGWTGEQAILTGEVIAPNSPNAWKGILELECLRQPAHRVSRSKWKQLIFRPQDVAIRAVLLIRADTTSNIQDSLLQQCRRDYNRERTDLNNVRLRAEEHFEHVEMQVELCGGLGNATSILQESYKTAQLTCRRWRLQNKDENRKITIARAALQPLASFVQSLSWVEAQASSSSSSRIEPASVETRRVSVPSHAVSVSPEPEGEIVDV
jgi:hypothetical protein